MTKKVAFVYITRFKDYSVVYEYCTTLANRGFKVCYLGIGDVEESYTSDSGVQVIQFSRSRIRSMWDFAKAVIQSLKTLQPDLIHVFHFRWCFLLPVVAKFNFKFLLDVRTVHVANKKGSHSHLTPAKNFITWFESQFFRYAIALTPAIRRMLLPSWKKIPVIPLGANTARFNPPHKAALREEVRRALHIEETDKVFVYSGTVSPARKTEDILYAFGQLCTDSDNIRLIIVGNDKDDPGRIKVLQNICIDLGIGKKVYLTGFIPFENVNQYYAAADIGICYVPQTSYYNFQPAIKLFEYAAAGLIVIATRTKANEAVISHQVNGYLCYDTPSDLFHTMKTVLNDEGPAWVRIRQAASEMAIGYSWESIIENHVCRYYNEIKL